jgi:hypothetical protein
VPTPFNVQPRAEDWITMTNPKNRYSKRFYRKGKVLEDGFDKWMKSKSYATEENAIKAFHRLVAKAKKQGFVDNAITKAKEWDAEPLYMPETDYSAVLAGDGFTLAELGKLAVRSGKLIACDPFLADEEPLARRVPKGTYAVTAAIRRKGKAKAGICAAAFIRFAAGKVTRWVSAGDYGVDAGVGCFIDSATVIARDALSAELKQKRSEGFRHAALDGLVAFQSGLGDGSYASHWGLGKGGKLLCLVTDFCVAG